MFTGIIQGVGRIAGKRSIGGGVGLDIDAGFALSDPEEGESIAVSGICLTAYRIGGHRFSADVSPETLARTKLGGLQIGDRVNLERALRLADRLGGHLVSGHIDAQGAVVRRKEVGDYTIFTFSLPERLDRYIIEKGSIAIDGISLTVNSSSPGEFSVSIIPHTLAATTLGALQAGSRVNIEVDMIGKYVEKMLLPRDHSGETAAVGGISSGFLAKHGFM